MKPFDSSTENTNSSGFDDTDSIDVIDHDLEFSSILDISFATRTKSAFHLYFAKINVSISIPSAVGYLFFVIITIQTFLTSLHLYCKDLWPHDNFFTLFSQILSYLWIGSIDLDDNTGTIIFGYSSSMLILILLALTIWRGFTFKKYMTMRRVEMWLSMITFKIVIPFFLPAIAATVPNSIYNIVKGKLLELDVLSIIFPLIAFILFIIFYYSIVIRRVLPENMPTGEWLPQYSLLSLLHCSIMTLCSVIAGCIGNPKGSIVFSIFMFLFSVLLGSFTFISSSFTKRNVSIFFSVLRITVGFISLVQGINLFLDKHLKPELIILLALIFFVLFYVIAYFLNIQYLSKILMIFDACYESPGSSLQIIKNTMKTPLLFIGCFSAAIEQCHPFLLTVDLLDISELIWQNNFDLFLFFGRLASLYPSKTNTMMYIASLISNLQEVSSLTTYLAQFRYIARSRQIKMTPQVKHEIDDILEQYDSYKLVIRRIWENILQKNIKTFWEDVYKYNIKTRETEIILQQLSEEYPQNEAVLQARITFLSTLKKDIIEESKLKKKIEKLRMEGPLKSDIGFPIALNIFPHFSPLFEETSLHLEIPQENVALSDVNKDLILSDAEELEPSNKTFEIAIQQLTSKSPLGRLWIILLILIIATVIVLIVYLVLHFIYVRKFLEKESNGVNFLVTLNKAIFDLNMMFFYIMVYPSTFPGYAASIQPDFMEKVSPSLYPDRIPPLNITADCISQFAGSASDYITSLMQIVADLDQADENVKIINFLLTNEHPTTGIVLTSAINQILMDSKALLQFKDPKSYLQSDEFILIYLHYQSVSQLLTNITFYSLEYSSSINPNSTSLLANMMMLVLFLTVLLITVPFVIYLYILYIQYDAIAVSFSYFSNTQIRNVINEFQTGTLKTDDDASAIAHINQFTPFRTVEYVYNSIIFCVSFIPMLILCLVTYISSNQYCTTIHDLALKIFTLYPAFSELQLGSGYLIRTAQYDTDITFSSKYNSRDYIADQAFMCYYLSITYFAMGMWSEVAGANAYYQQNAFDIDTFRDVYHFNHVPQSYSYFEQFSSESLLRSTDIVVGYSLTYLLEHSNATIFPANMTDNLMMSLLYWFGSFSYSNRTQVYFSIVEDSVRIQIETYWVIQNVTSILVFVFQFIALLKMVLYLRFKHKTIQAALSFFNYLTPNAVIHNQVAITLLESGKISIEKATTSYENSRKIIDSWPQGFLLLNSDLVIIDSNPAFLSIVQQDDINGMALDELITKNEEELNSENDDALEIDPTKLNSWTKFLLHLNELVNGLYPPQFTQNITGKLHDGQVIHFTCSVIAMNQNGAAEECDELPIEKIAIIFDDCTQIYMRQQIIEQEQSVTKGILVRMMPERIVKTYMNNNYDGISYVTQSATIGMISIELESPIDKDKAQSAFSFYSNLYQEFDKNINEYQLLCKVRSFGSTYVFAGGLFADSSRPEKHAEESLRFALAMIAAADDYSKQNGLNIKILAGLDSGGPVVAGVIEQQRPTFQVVGSIMESTTQMTLTGMDRYVQVTRAVYELVFAAGFRITEYANTELSRDEAIITYLVNSK